MPRREQRPRAALFPLRGEDRWNLPGGARRGLHLALAVTALAIGADAALAATVKPQAGLDGVIRLDIRSGDEVPESGGDLATIQGEGLAAAKPGATADEAKGRIVLAAVSGPDSGLEPSVPSGAPAGVSAEGGAGGQAQAEAAAGPEEVPVSHASAPAEPEAGRAQRSAARDRGDFGQLRTFGGPGPCYWRHGAFGAAEHRDRCGYPARSTPGSGQPRPVQFAGALGGGGGSASPAAPPEAPPRPGAPVVQPAPVPVPPAWLLLATTAAPLVLRRRRR